MTPTPPLVPKPKNLFLRVLVGLGIGLGVLVLAAVLTWPIFRYRQERRIDAELAKIRAAGYPVTWEELDRWYTKPASNDCTAIYTNALALLPNSTFALKNLPFFSSSMGLKKEVKLVPGKSLLPETLPAIRAFLTTNEAPLAMFRQMRGVPACRYPVDLSRGPAAMMSHIPKARTGARMLAMEALLHAEEGKTQEATESLLAGAALANSFQREPCVISRLVLLACHGVNLTALEWSLSRTAFTDEQLVALSNSLRESGDPTGMERAMAGERAGMVGTFEQLRSGEMPFDIFDIVTTQAQKDAGEGKTRKLIWKLLGLIWRGSGVFQADMLFCIEKENENVAAARLPLEKRIAAAKSLKNRVENKAPRYCILSRLLPAVGRAIEADVGGLTQLQVAETALAVERYRLKHGKLPGGLGELVPEFLEKVPVDPFDGKELRYVICEKGFTVYSVGPDGVDNGGVKLDKDGREFQPGTDVTFSVVR